MTGFEAFRTKMQAADVREAAIAAFERSYAKLVNKESGMLEEAAINAVAELPTIGPDTDFDPDLLRQTVVIKLNGGLGTSMGLQKAKSLLPVKDGQTFLDVIAQQIVALRERTGAQVRFLLMNSFATSADTLEHLQRYAQHGLAQADSVELMQNRVPKVAVDTLAPAACPDQADLEWCPPGHGDLYPALSGSGWLDQLLDDGVRYAFISNSDNLGALLSASLLKYFADADCPFLMEVTRRTEGDKKGGHLALRKSDGKLVLREVAQCPDDDIGHFQNIDKHRFFNTNNLWLRLDALKAVLDGGNGVLPLPMICNSKTVDPRDKSSLAVYQLETAMGAAVECFTGAGAINVPRSRFAPVKTTGDLFALRSDAYHLDDDGRIRLVAERNGVPPLVSLSDEYKHFDSLDALGVPSIVGATSLAVKGPWHFHRDAIIRGSVSLTNASQNTATLPAGEWVDQTVDAAEL
ncbi:MAG: UTP--glucose-1-phosphate uridylyltransferase [Chromatiales bacterium]|jgi:UTP--glucose-1-phosphate uridylyltransferase|nr:UTP--glucose-1-phosphate uridylyltransferase [Chromatiales bacterium]